MALFTSAPAAESSFTTAAPHGCGEGTDDGRRRREQSQQGECTALLTAAVSTHML